VGKQILQTRVERGWAVKRDDESVVFGVVHAKQTLRKLGLLGAQTGVARAGAGLKGGRHGKMLAQVAYIG
jgi:hypothetical protein